MAHRQKHKRVRIATVDEIEKELNRVKTRKKFFTILKSTVFTLTSIASVVVLICVLLMPVFKIFGSSMTPTLQNGNVVVALKGSNFKTGDMIGFYYNNKILVKRVIAQAGDWVNIDKDGNVYVNDKLLNEPYAQDKARGECNIEFPYQVPEERIFVLGDHRSTSVDSRSNMVGCVAAEQIVGKILFRVWPLDSFGPLE